MTSTKTPNRLSGRTKIITAASIGAVGLASVFAIGANLGILTSADQNDVGNVSAAGDLVPVDTQVVDVYLDAQGNPISSASDAAAPAGSQRFTIDQAGTVDASATADGVQVDLVSPASGWTAGPATSSGSRTTIVFTNGSRTLQFVASVGPDGSVVGDVTESTVVAQTPKRDDDHESDDHESDDHDYEGGDSDD